MRGVGGRSAGHVRMGWAVSAKAQRHAARVEGGGRGMLTAAPAVGEESALLLREGWGALRRRHGPRIAGGWPRRRAGDVAGRIVGAGCGWGRRRTGGGGVGLVSGW